VFLQRCQRDELFNPAAMIAKKAVEMLGELRDRHAALVVAHPGHELRVFNWLTAARPVVFVLTDGSGRTGKSRLERTTRYLDKCGIRRGNIYGRLTDGEFYRAVINADVSLFETLTRQLTEELIELRIDYVVGDALEGYNPAHDLCRMMLNAAIRKAGRMGRSIDNYGVALTTKPGCSSNAKADQEITLVATQPAILRKLEAARDYSELTNDVTSILEQEGDRALRVEVLHRVIDDGTEMLSAEVPYYETYGEKQVAVGLYEEVIRYRKHILPIAAVLERFANS
jgi:hypothetical protein